jgi:GNAT superfamily N-acetyltransferase
VLPAAVDAEIVRPLRRAILRPGAGAAELRYDHDDAPDTLHAAVRAGGAVVAIASVMREAHPHEPRPGDWRLRGMATVPELRGRGLGGALLAFCEEHVRRHDGRRLWCNARTGALAFYERAGFRAQGGVFEIERIGPHVVMSKPLG